MKTIQWLTVVIAALVALIGFLQYLTARQNAVFDLFDKQFKIYEIVNNCVIQVVRNPLYFEKDLEKEFLKAVSEAYFLFGDDVNDYLEMLGKDILQVRGSTNLQANADKREQAEGRIHKFYETGQPLFAKYMRFSQPVPLISRIAAWFRRRN